MRTLILIIDSVQVNFTVGGDPPSAFMNFIYDTVLSGDYVIELWAASDQIHSTFTLSFAQLNSTNPGSAHFGTVCFQLCFGNGFFLFCKLSGISSVGC